MNYRCFVRPRPRASEIGQGAALFLETKGQP